MPLPKSCTVVYIYSPSVVNLYSIRYEVRTRAVSCREYLDVDAVKVNLSSV